MLRQKDQFRKKQLQKQIQSVNLDISLLNGISKQSKLQSPFQKSQSKQSLLGLSQILKNKNQKYANYQHQKGETRQWLRQKGLDFKKINEQIKQTAQIAAQIPTIPRSQISQLRIGELGPRKQQQLAQSGKQYGFTSENQFQFILKQKQLIMSKIITQSMSGTSSRNNTRTALMKKIKGQLTQVKNHSVIVNSQFYQKQSMNIKEPRQQAFLKNRNQYFDFVQVLATTGFNQSIQRLKTIKPFWKIVIEHVKTVQHYAPYLENFNTKNQPKQQFDSAQLHMNAFLMMKSLKFVQNYFDKKLPDSFNFIQKLTDLVRQFQRKNQKIRVWRSYSGQPSWAFAFFLLRAGRMNDLKRVLQNVDRQYLQDLISYQQSVDKQKPQPSMKRYDTHKYRDNFYGLLVNVLRANPAIDTEIIFSQNLNRVWIVLRTLGIYRKNKDIERQYQNVLQDMFVQAAQFPQDLTKQRVFDYLYLGAYDRFISLFEILNRQKFITKYSQFNEDDYFHLFTVINYYPELLGRSDTKSKQEFQQMYQIALLKYLQKLRKEDCNKQLPRYLLLAPPESVQFVACQFIKTREQYQKFDWRQLKALLIERDQNNGQKLFMYLSEQVLDKLTLSTYQDYLFAGQKYQKTFDKSVQSTEKWQNCYISILLKYLFFTQKKHDLLLRDSSQQVQNSLANFQNDLFQFFGLRKGENIDQLQRDMDQIIKKIKGIQNKMQQSIEDPNNRDQSYYFSVILPFEFYRQFSLLSKWLENPTENFKNIKEFNQMWLINASSDSQSEDQTYQVAMVLDFLNRNFSKPITSLYVFYLKRLIESKKTLASNQNDYHGVVDYVQSMLKSLVNLQNYYRSQKHISNQSQRQYLENHLSSCPEYRQLKRSLNQYIGEFSIKPSNGLDKGSLNRGSNDRGNDRNLQSGGRGRESNSKNFTFGEYVR